VITANAVKGMVKINAKKAIITAEGNIASCRTRQSCKGFMKIRFYSTNIWKCVLNNTFGRTIQLRQELHKYPEVSERNKTAQRIFRFSAKYKPDEIITNMGKMEFGHL
jgi:hypothetical protein